MARKKNDLLSNEAVKTYLLALVNEEGYEVVKQLPVRDFKSEYVIAEKQKININRLRSILYKLYSKNLVAYYKTRDPVKGWFIYHWKFFPEKLIELVLKDMGKDLETAEGEADVGNERYICNQCLIEYTFEDAFNENFTCPNDNTPLELSKKRGLKTAVSKLKKAIKELEHLS